MLSQEVAVTEHKAMPTVHRYSGIGNGYLRRGLQSTLAMGQAPIVLTTK